MSDARMDTATLALDETAQWLTAAVAQLEKMHKEQLALAPHMDIEINPQHMKQLIEGLRACAGNVRGAAADLTVRP